MKTIIAIPLSHLDVLNITENKERIFIIHLNKKTNELSKVQMGELGKNTKAVLKGESFAYFMEINEIVEDRPLYKLEITEENNVISSEIVNGMNLDLTDIVTGEYDIKTKYKKLIK